MDDVVKFNIYCSPLARQKTSSQPQLPQWFSVLCLSLFGALRELLSRWLKITFADKTQHKHLIESGTFSVPGLHNSLFDCESNASASAGSAIGKCAPDMTGIHRALEDSKAGRVVNSQTRSASSLKPWGRRGGEEWWWMMTVARIHPHKQRNLGDL